MMQLSCKLITLATIAFYNKIDTFYLHYRGQFEIRNGYIFQTKCFLAIVTIEVSMQVVYIAAAFTFTN